MPAAPSDTQRRHTPGTVAACVASRARAITVLALATAIVACQSAPPAPPPAPAAAPEPMPVVVEPAVTTLSLVSAPAIELLVPPPPEDTDLLVRIRRELVLADGPGAEDPMVARELEWFAAHQEYLQRVFERSERYLFYIVNELERRHMPSDLALLPIVESAFDPFAYSHGRAAGLWQIIPGTGRRLGLKQNWWYDARRDVVESTRAALDYLGDLATQFDGDWLLAVAGYNSGEGNVARALSRAADTPETPGDFWSVRQYLPVETRTYVPRLVALTKLVADPTAYGVTLPSVPNEPYFAAIDTGGQLDMALAAELADIDADTLYALNPGVNRWATDPDGPHRLLVPLEVAATLENGLATLGARERVQWSRHEIKRGETLITLAQRYRTTPAVLKEANNLHNNLIRAGDYLMIPHAVKSLGAYTQTADARAERQRAQPHGSGNERKHVVAAGESLWSISQQYHVGVRELASWNAMAPGDVLSVGRTLVVWSDTPPAPTAASTERIRRLTYVVRSGDSLSAIAARFRVRVTELLQWNSLPLSRYLKPGQQLVMYVDVTKQSG